MSLLQRRMVMKTILGLLTIFVLVTSTASAQHNANNVTGRWKVNVAGEGFAGHAMPSVELELEQNGTKVTGNFLIPNHGDLPMEGEFVDGKLTIHATEDGFMKLQLTATLNDKGQFNGTLDGTIGSHTWTAEREDG